LILLVSSREEGLPSVTASQVEVYSNLLVVPRADRDSDEQAAYAVAARLQRADRSGSLDGFFNPLMTPEEQKVAAAEGWIFDVV
jgi:hypothetical protein